MSKGIYAQGLAVLLQQPVGLEEIAQLLSAFHIVRRIESGAGWPISGPALLIACPPGINGQVTVDLVDRPWPDDMGDSQKAAELFAAWSMGSFGPFTYPGSLERSFKQPWRWDEARQVAGPHGAFLRIRLTGAVPAAESHLRSANEDPLAELRFVTSVTQAVLDHPRALAYFDPNGEVLLPPALVRESLAQAAEHGLAPFELWSGIRLYNVNQGWIVMDTVGNWQLDMPDHESAFRGQSFQPPDVDRFLRNVSFYILGNGAVIKDKDTTDGPGGVPWRARICEESLLKPPRRVYRWFPANEAVVPAFLRPPNP